MNFKRFSNSLIFFLLSILGINYVSAVTIAPLELITNNIAKFFNFEVFTSETMQLGFLRFLLWILIFSILFWSGSRFVFKGDEGRKTAGFVAAIMGLIGVVFMPANAVMGIGTAYSAVFFTLLTVGLGGGAIYIAFAELDGSEKNEWWKDLMGFLLILFAILILNVVSIIMSGGSVV